VRSHRESEQVHERVFPAKVRRCGEYRGPRQRNVRLRRETSRGDAILHGFALERHRLCRRWAPGMHLHM